MVILILSILLFFITLFIILVRILSKEKTKISFKEGLDLTDLPIVTFYCNNRKLHFLLDTGSNISYIDKSLINHLPWKDLNEKSSTIGVGGKDIITHHYEIAIYYKDQRFVETFGALDLKQTFEAIEAESGIGLHGILGNSFFEKYRYILDFRELIAYR